MKTQLHAITLLLSLATFTSASMAADYNEATEGDLRDHGRPRLISLDPGQNVIRGSTHFGTPATPTLSDVDEFTFRVPEGTVVVMDSIRYEYSFTSLFGSINALGAALQIGEGIPHRRSIPLYHSGGTVGDSFWLFSDGTVPGTGVTPSPVAPEFFEVVDSQVDYSRPAPLLRPGVYWFSPSGHKFGTGEHGGSWSYSITITVTPLP